MKPAWSAAVVVAFGLSATPALAAWAQTATSGPPVPPPTKQVVPFDLDAGPVAEPVVLTAPRSEDFWIVLKNRAPRGLYRVTYDWIIAPSTPRRPPDGALHSQYDLSRYGTLPGTRHTGSPCDELQSRGVDVLRARDEHELTEALRAYRAAAATGRCTERVYPPASFLQELVDMQVRGVHALWEGDELRYVVERLDETTREPLRTWRFTVRPQSLALPWKYPNEEAWIVGETSRDIAEMLLYARDRRLRSADALTLSATPEAAAGKLPRYSVAITIQGLTPQRRVLSFETHVWSPASYEPLAAAVLQASGSKPARPAGEGLLTETLTHPTGRALAQESLRLSRRLEEAMLDPAAHEQAALVIGALALRETAAGFTDPRQELCRMSAHLALARALRQGTPSRLADYAEAMLLTLVKRQRDALARLDALEQQGQPRRWAPVLRALRIRNTRDWRILADPPNATLLERLEHFRALSSSLGRSHAMEFFETFEPEPMSDWGRITGQEGWSVEQGHVFATSLPSLELNEAAEVWKTLTGKPVAGDALVALLNARPQRLVVEAGGRAAPQVLGWGIWARYFQRNLCFAAEASAQFLSSMLGLPEDAADGRIELSEKLSRLEFWPALALAWAESSPEPPMAPAAVAELEKTACAQGLALAQSEPEDIPMRVWSVLERSCAEPRDAQLGPRWLGRLAPAGTALVLWNRALAVEGRTRRPPDSPEDLYAIAPFDPDVLDMLPPLAEEAPASEVLARYTSLAGYVIGPMQRLAEAYRSDPAAFRAIYAKITAIQPASYLTLAGYLEDMGLEEEAAAAYEEAIEKARDRVAVSNSVLWLVGYYCDRGRIDRARGVAEMAAGVYSSLGLQAKAYFLERMGRYPEAEQWYRKIVERYGETDRGALDRFYIRYEQRVGDGRFAREATAALAHVFPAGLERVSIDELTSAPAAGEGSRVPGWWERGARFGLLKGDVVVALDGHRVRNNAQWDALWTLEDGPRATVIAWRQGRYVEVKGELKRIKYSPISRPM